ncbi:MAG: class I tRNA ligase family protein [Phycisphaeraceae bacterium]
MKYDFASIEPRWQQYWDEQRTFGALNPGEAGFDPAKPKYYVLDMFPYPSGVGLHVGHPLGYIATDIVARYKRMKGFNVLHPMGYDAFGLPAEQFAVEQGVHPRQTTEQNIANMTRQLKQLGLSYDWDRRIATTDTDYYKWTQWIFLRLFNSWYDPTQRRVRPIEELFAVLSSGQLLVGIESEAVWPPQPESLDAVIGLPVGTRKFHELNPDEQRAFIDAQRLAYIDEVPVNWCPQLGTVLANEEVTNEGRSDRGNYPVYKRPLRQWMLRITALADRLIDDLAPLAWPEPIKQMQRNWIGRSDGAYVHFPLAYGSSSGSDDVISVFTTRPDTLFGATYMVLAPEHPLVDALSTSEQYHAVNEYRRQAAGKSDMDRIAEAGAGAKTGVFTGAHAINPVNNQKIPIWIADYVLTGYGTGAIMAVPGHDERDFAFARHFRLPIRAVVMPDEAWLKAHQPPERSDESGQSLAVWYSEHPEDFAKAFADEGVAVNSANDDLSLDDLPTAGAKPLISQWLEQTGRGRAAVQYKLRDWLFSRQRYWGEPFPILHGQDGRIIGVEDSELPVLLPEMDDFRPAASEDPQAPPQPPLSRAPLAWRQVVKDGQTWTREFNTMPQWAGSCWYYLRFLDPKNEQRFVSEEAERYWMVSSKGQGPPAKGQADAEERGAIAAKSEIRNPKSEIHFGGVDLYVGGVEHAVLHLLYARFWHKVLFDLGYVSTPEPFGRLYNQGYIQAYCYRDLRGIAVPAAEVVNAQGQPASVVQGQKGQQFFYQGQPVTEEYGKMGKGLKNAIAPDEVCGKYGADTLRLYEMYMGPLDQSKPWATRDITGVHRFLQRFWRLLVNDETGQLRVGEGEPSPELRRLLHNTIKRVTDAMETLSFNVGIAALIELNNELVKQHSSDQAAGAAASGATSGGTSGAASGAASGGASGGVPRAVVETMVLLLSPMAPHIAEELWRLLGHGQSLAYHAWPAYDPALLLGASIEYPVQINGKLKARITVARDADVAAVEAAARADAKVTAAVEGSTIRKVIVVPGRLVNIVAS